MEIKHKIFKRKTGKSAGKWIYRIEYFNQTTGKIQVIERHTDRRSEATDLCKVKIDEIKKTFGQIQKGERMTFEQLADLCEKQFYQQVVIVEGRKVAGARSYRTAKTNLNILKSFFGKRLIGEITSENLTDYKLHRLSSKLERNEKANVKISTVNRELSTMRKVMRYAYSKGWVLKDIFFNAKVIDPSSEIERKRVLTLDEERRLLENCEGERQITYKRKKRGSQEKEEVTGTFSIDNPHLKAIIMLAIDTAMRRGEIFKLRWQDIDFDNNLIHIVGTHTKTERERIVPLSARVKFELEKLKEITEGERPFPFTDIKRSFATAKRLAGIDDLHFHDLRRTAITRMIQQGTPLAFAGKIAGHTQLQTTLKHYTATDSNLIAEIAERINNFNSTNNETLQIKSNLLN